MPDYKLKVGFSVPKKKFRSSVSRHRVRRLMAEAWRLNKAMLLDALPEGKQLHVFLVFTSPELPAYELVLAQVVAAIHKLKIIINP
jgi:ribonuclease P protein component